jgi:hypothetical protein
MVEVIGSGKHSSLLRYGNNYCCKKFYSTFPETNALAYFVDMLVTKVFYNIFTC